MNGIEYTYPYLIYYIYTLVLFILERDKKLTFRVLRFLELLGFFVFFGLRGYVYSDAFQYYIMFDSLPAFPDMTFEEFSLGHRSIEPLFQILIKITKIFSDDYIIFQCINSIIDLFLLDKVFRRYNKYYCLGFLLFSIFYGFLIEFNLLRNFKAILLFFLSLKYIKERSIYKYLVMIILATFFHPSSLIYVPMYWVLNIKFPKILLLCLLSIGSIFPLLNIKLFSSIFELPIFQLISYGSYADGDSYNIGLRSIERIAFFILFYKFYYRDDEYRMFYNLYFIFFFFFNCMYEFEIFVIRVSLLFIPYWIVIDRVYNLMTSKMKKIFIGVIIMFGVVIIYNDNKTATSRYTNVLFGNVDYQESKRIFESALSD